MTIERLTNDVAVELERIAKANKGVLTPENVLRNAESKRSPIHKCFTWDDTEAARAYRLYQASALIRTVKCTIYQHDQDEPVKVRAFVNVQSNERDETGKTKQGVYVPMETALKVNDYKAQMLENAARELAAFKRKYIVLKELAGVICEINKLQLEFAK